MEVRANDNTRSFITQDNARRHIRKILGEGPHAAHVRWVIIPKTSAPIGATDLPKGTRWCVAVFLNDADREYYGMLDFASEGVLVIV